MNSGNRCIPSQNEQSAACEIIRLLTSISCSSVNINISQGCLTVTSEGDWGEVGDTIQVLRFFNSAIIPTVYFYTIYINTRTNASVVGITDENTEPCPGGSPWAFEYFICDDGNQKIVRLCGDSCTDYTVEYLDLDRTTTTEPEEWNLVTAGPCPDFVTNATSNVSRVNATGAGSVTGGALGVSITNVGNANGIVLGEDIYPNQSINLGAAYNNFNNTFYFLPAITYDGTGTTLSITVVFF